MKASSIFLSVCLAGLAMPVFGQNSLSWTNETVGKFSDKNNWGEIVLDGQFVHVAPTAADNAYFTVLLGAVNGRSYTVILNAGDAARNTTLGGGVIFDVEGAANLGETILSEDQLTVTGPGTLTTSPLNHSGVLNISGAKVVTSRLEFSSGPADVIVTGGGRFTSDTTASQRIATGSALVAGGGSLWKNTGLLKMADATMRGGGQITADVVTNGTLLVDGHGSAFTTFGHLEIHALTVTNSGRIYNDTANLSFVGLVDGARSLWTINDRITMDGGAALTIQNGGQLQAATFHADSSVFVTGTNSQLRLSRDLAVGAAEFGDGKVEVSAGGFVQSSTGFIGGNSSGSVTVRDSGSAWVLVKGLSVGDLTGGSLFVAGSGRVSLGDNSVFGIGTEFTGSGVVEIDDLGSVLEAFEVNVGREGIGTLRVQSGARMVSEKLVIGALGGSKGSVIVAGNPSSLEVLDGMIIGDQGQGQLTVTAGGLVKTTRLYIGQNNSTANNGVTVTGTGATLSIASELFVGNGGPGSLSVLAGGQVITTNSNAELGISETPGSLGTMTVDGAGSKVNWGLIIVGVRASGSMKISNGGQVDAELMAVGSPNSPGTTTVTGNGSQLRLQFGLQVGGTTSQFQGPGLLAVDAGGFVQVDTKLRLFRAGVVQLNGGSVNIGALGQIPPASVLNVTTGGRLAGPGKVIGQIVRNGGKVLPGVSDGTLTIAADYEQTSSGELSIDLAGPVPDSGYDVLNVTGDVTLAGKLTLNFINGFAPKAGQVFEFLKFGTNIVGNFDQIEITGLSSAFQYQVKQIGAGTLSLVALNDGIATSPPLLSIERVGVDLLVSWPANVQSFVLQSSPDLGSTNWIDLITTANQLSIQTTNAMKFFRLIKR